MNYLGLQKDTLTKVASSLNELLANYHVYYQNLRSFHWHITGSSFFDLHEFFEELYDDAKLKIDEVAERILTIGHKPLGSLHDYLKDAAISESLDMMEDDKMVETILRNHTTIIAIMREVINEAAEVNDEGTIDMMGGFLGNMEKKSWMLHSWLQRRRAGFTIKQNTHVDHAIAK